MKDEALKLALEALEIQAYNSGDEKYTQAITIIKQALAAQPAPVQPVAWIEHHKGGDNLEWDNPGGKCTALYTTPPAAQPAAPDGWRIEIADKNWMDVCLVSPFGEAWKFRSGVGGSDQFIWKFLTAMLAAAPKKDKE